MKSSSIEFSLNIAARERAFLALHGVKSLGELQRKQANEAKGGRLSEPPVSFIDGTAEELGVSRDTIKRALRRGRVPGLAKLVGTAGDCGPSKTSS